MEEIIPSLARHSTRSLRINPTKPDDGTSSIEPTSFALHELISGAVAGSAGIFVGHPLDTLKVRMQMLPSTSSTSLSALLFHSQYGSVWKGVGAPVTTAGVLNAQIFFTYGRSTGLWNDYFQLQKEESSLLRDGICGGFTGLISAIIMCPTEHVKTRLQTQHKSNVVVTNGSGEVMYRNELHATRHIYETTGITGLYRGFVATAARQGPSFAVYFATYNLLKEQSSKYFQRESLSTSIAAGGIAGSLSWAVVYPIDLIKNRIQAMPLDSKMNHSMVATARQFVQENGVRALFRGFWLTVIRAFPVNGVIFPTYELTLKALKQD
jgi:solute carrier family 25 carnitine/acylcarnitine transporter 20/29